MKHWQAITIFTIGAGLFGFTPVFVKLNFAANFTLSQLIVSQMILATAILWMLAFLKRIKFTVTNKQTLSLMLAGTFNGITGIFYYTSMQHVPASIAIILLFQFVWVGVLYEWILDKRKPTIPTIISVVLTLIGVFFAANVMTGGISKLPMIGIMFGLLSAFSYAAFILVSGRVATQIDPLLRALLMITGSLILVFIIFRPTFLFTDSIFQSYWLYGLGGALFGAVLPPLCFSISAPHLSSSLATILGSIELPVAIIAASVILSETVTWVQWIGIVLIIFAISFNEIRLLVINRIGDKQKST
ncbi:DMT family transporter [Pueribacillus sp. YX66]|uniref:EamA family transporter n=1 Tax=Pueribacillus sp. YX66 TaxID=3229242 RepID=UPI00358D5C33